MLIIVIELPMKAVTFTDVLFFLTLSKAATKNGASMPIAEIYKSMIVFNKINCQK